LEEGGAKKKRGKNNPPEKKKNKTVPEIGVKLRAHRFRFPERP